MRIPGVCAAVGAGLLLLVAPIMVGWSVIGYIAPPSWDPGAPGLLFGGGLVAGLGAIVAGALLLIRRLRPPGRRFRWEVAALVVVIVTALWGPGWGIGSYLWIVNGGGRMDARIEQSN